MSTVKSCERFEAGIVQRQFNRLVPSKVFSA
jgi:hypothetical protein